MEQDRTPVVSFISLNWKGKPLVNFETVVNLIGGTRTRGGLKVNPTFAAKLYFCLNWADPSS